MRPPTGCLYVLVLSVWVHGSAGDFFPLRAGNWWEYHGCLQQTRGDFWLTHSHTPTMRRMEVLATKGASDSATLVVRFVVRTCQDLRDDQFDWSRLQQPFDTSYHFGGPDTILVRCRQVEDVVIFDSFPRSPRELTQNYDMAHHVLRAGDSVRLYQDSPSVWFGVWESGESGDTTGSGQPVIHVGNPRPPRSWQFARDVGYVGKTEVACSGQDCDEYRERLYGFGTAGGSTVRQARSVTPGSLGVWFVGRGSYLCRLYCVNGRLLPSASPRALGAGVYFLTPPGGTHPGAVHAAVRP